MAKTDQAGRPIVVVTGMGVVTSLGAGREDNWRKLTAGESGIREIKRISTEGLKTRIAGTIEGSITTEELIVEGSARITGDVTYQTIAIAVGGQVDGKLTHKDATGQGDLKLVKS